MIKTYNVTWEINLNGDYVATAYDETGRFVACAVCQTEPAARNQLRAMLRRLHARQKQVPPPETMSIEIYEPQTQSVEHIARVHAAVEFNRARADELESQEKEITNASTDPKTA